MQARLENKNCVSNTRAPGNCWRSGVWHWLSDPAAACDNSEQEALVCPETGAEAENTAWEAWFFSSSAYSKIWLFSSDLITYSDYRNPLFIFLGRLNTRRWNDGIIFRMILLLEPCLALLQVRQDLLLPATARKTAWNPALIRLRWC